MTEDEDVEKWKNEEHEEEDKEEQEWDRQVILIPLILIRAAIHKQKRAESVIHESNLLFRSQVQRTAANQHSVHSSSYVWKIMNGPQSREIMQTKTITISHFFTTRNPSRGKRGWTRRET